MPIDPTVLTIVTTGSSLLSGWLLNRHRDLQRRADEADVRRSAIDTRVAVLEIRLQEKNAALERLTLRLEQIDTRLADIPKLTGMLGMLTTALEKVVPRDEHENIWHNQNGRFAALESAIQKLQTRP